MRLIFYHNFFSFMFKLTSGNQLAINHNQKKSLRFLQTHRQNLITKVFIG